MSFRRIIVYRDISRYGETMREESTHGMRRRHHDGDGPPRRGPQEGPERGFGHGHGFGHGRGFAQGRSPSDRARRGEARYLFLDALRDGPKHGYEIIRAFEERSSGRYVPSPGTVYPTLQMLLDIGLVSAEADQDKRVYRLTEAGLAELAEHAEQVEEFWKRFGASDEPGMQTEVSFLRDEVEHLERTIWSGLRHSARSGDLELIRGVRQLVETCQVAVRKLIGGEGS